MEFSVLGLNDNAHVSLNTCEKNGIVYVDIKMTLDGESIPEKFKIRWSFPDTDCYSTWSPSLKADRFLAPNWRKRKTESRLASWMPVQSLISMSGQNRLCIALSDTKTPVSIATGIREETAAFDCDVEFFTVPTAAIKEYSATLRLDTRDIPYYDSIYDVTRWWEEDCGYSPAYVPEHARLPMNSLWYSFHQQLDPDEIIRQCKLSKPLGMDTVIIDDGWQTDDNNRGYAYCGDWEVTPTKFPDMREFVDRVHAEGMKVMLWYSVPYIGVHSKAYQKFHDMLLDSSGKEWFCADPRFKEVRGFLTETYVNAVRSWGLDGLKLDFIDAFKLNGKSLEYDPRRDYTSLEDAIDALMNEVTAALREINPEILIEFRQSYIGPTIRKYGNMLRVGDCPNDAIRNRCAVVDMRLTSGNTPVHSDMLMWNYGDTVESAALQFANILYSVPQISMLIDRLSDEHFKMLRYYLSFWREHRKILLDGRLTATNPESCYGIVRADLDMRAVITLYNETMVENVGKYAAVVNASRSGTVYVKDCAGREYEIVSCTGKKLQSGVFGSEGISAVNVPMCGILFVK